MDLPATQTMLTMSNDQINKYKELYSQLVSAFAGLHNETLVFVRTRGREPGLATRKHLRAVEGFAKELKRQGLLVYKEHVANLKAEKKLQREEKARPKRTKPMPRKPKKEKQNDNN